MKLAVHVKLSQIHVAVTSDKDVVGVTYFKNLRQLHFLVVEDGVNAVNRLLGLMRCSALGFLMQYWNQSPKDA